VLIIELPQEMLNLYRPLLCEMEEMNQELTLAEFIEASNRLYDSLYLPERNELLHYKKKVKRSTSIEPMFQVRINKEHSL